MSLRTKLTLLLTLFTLLICGLLALTFLAMESQSVVRTYINGEARWTKAHKDAVYFLTRYANEHEAELYRNFEKSLTIIEGSKRARLALEKQEADFAEAKIGFIQGGVHPDEILAASILFVYCRSLRIIDQAIGLWQQGDAEIDTLREIATSLHQEISLGSNRDDTKIRIMLRQIAQINGRVSNYEERFSALLSEAARWLKLRLMLLFTLLTLLSIGLSFWLVRFFSSQWLKNIENLSLATQRVSSGKFGEDVRIEGHDELSELGKAFNKMSNHLFALTEQRDLIEKNLAVRAEQLSDAQSIAKLGNWEWDSISKLFDGSREFRKILVLDTSTISIPEQDVYDKFATEHQRLLRKLLNSTLVNATSASCECRIVLENGESRSVFFRMRGITQGNKVSGTLQDVTDIQKLQMSLIQSSRMASLGEMSSGLAHEINNPLGIISARATQLRRLLRERNPDLQRANQYLDSIDGVVDRIAAIVRSLRTYANSGEGDPYAAVNIKELIGSTLNLCGERLKNRGITITVNGFNPELTIECRRAQISQVLLNLISNAEYAVMKLDDRWIYIDVNEVGDFVQIGISNSGDKIPQSIAERVFQPFFTTKEVGEGTGLGLSIARGIIEEHGGHIDLAHDSQATRFEFQLRKQHVVQLH